MSNTLTVAGNTRTAWSLADEVSSQAKEISSVRAISTGTGPQQATVAWFERITATGSGASRALGTLPVTVLGVTGSLAVSNVRELLVSVVSGPTGGSYLLAGPAGVTGVTIGVGGQFQWLDYVAGATGTGTTISLASGITGAYTVDMAVIGIGTYSG